MPRAARFKITALGDLLQQLRYAPLETLERQMDAAERLVAELDPARNYPEEFIVFRITGYRPDASTGTSVLVGQALVPDLVNFIQLVSSRLKIAAHHGGRHALPLPEVCRRLNVSRKTIQRYRKSGLVCHYITDDDGSAQLACFEDALNRFIATHGKRISRASGFSRIDETMQQQILNEAKELHRVDGISLNEAALALSQKYQRAHETIRGLLRRYERREPIFSEVGPLREHESKRLYRAWRFGIASSKLAQRFGKTGTTIRRAVNRQRADLLVALDLQWIELPTFKLRDSEEVILSHPSVTHGLNRLPSGMDAIQFLHDLRSNETEREDDEEAMLAAYNILKRRARRVIDRFGAWPNASAIDGVETDLRWAVMLKRRLVALLLRGAMLRVQHHVQRPLESQTSDEIVSVIRRVVAVLSSVIETVDPARGQRIEKLTVLAIDRAMVKAPKQESAKRAFARHTAGVVMLRDPLAGLTPWDAMLEFRPDLKSRVTQLDAAAQELLVRRHGWDGTPPRTIAAIAKLRQETPSATTRSLQRAENELRRLAAQ